jgi:hypothetical protein
VLNEQAETPCRKSEELINFNIFFIVLKNVVVSVADEYQLITDKAANNTKSVLRDVYHLSDISIHDCVEELFLDISNYLHGDEKIDLRDSVFR